MSEFRDLLDQERRRHRMTDGSFRDLERRRDRKRRNRRLGSGFLALVIAGAGIGAGLYAFRPTGSAQPVDSPSPSQTATPPVTGSAVLSPSGPLQFVDDQRGWMIDARGQILATGDAGRTWTDQFPGPFSIVAIDMLDGQYGWGLGDAGEMVHTSDGGVSWTAWSTQPLSTFQFVTPQVGWGIRPGSDPSGPGMLMRTGDGGRTWSEQGREVGSLCAASQDVVWGTGTGDGGLPIVVRSGDGGASWVSSAALPSVEPWMTYQLRCTADGAEAFLLLTGGGAAGHVAYAAFQESFSDGQIDSHPVLVASFAAAALGIDAYNDDDPYPGVFTAVAPGTAYFVNWCPACDSPSASFVKSEGEPSGVTDRVPLVTGGGSAEPLGISFVSPEHGWVMLRVGAQQGQLTTILETTDGGATWTTLCDATSPCPGLQSVP
jgi:photosystem II stability/assembly factor-like uncharacterized protein